jgi:hypothetical protein
VSPEIAGTRLARILASPQNSRLRLIQRVLGTVNPNVPVYRVANSLYQETDPQGVNGRRGWSSGSYVAQIGLEGSFTLNFPNSEGEDGEYHRDRFLVCTYADYHPGDEWFEIWQDEELLFVGTPSGAVLDPANIQITGVDGWWLLNKVRETSAGIWNHGPRDVIERYCSAWASLQSDDFTAYTTAAGGALWTWATSDVTSPTGWLFNRAESYEGVVRVRPSAPGTTAYVKGTGKTINAGIGATQRDWSLEWRFVRSPLANAAATGGAPAANEYQAANSYVRFGFYLNATSLTGNEVFDVTIMEDTVFLRSGDPELNTQGWKLNTKVNTDPDTVSTVKFEQRDYWLFVYLNGTLLGCLPMLDYTGQDVMDYTSSVLTPFCLVRAGTLGGDEYAILEHFSLRQAVPLLQTQGNKQTAHAVTITGGPTAGSYTLSYKGQTTTAIPRVNDPGAALNLLGAVTADGGVTTSGAYPNWVVTWRTAGFRQTPVAVSSLTGGTSPGVSVRLATDADGVVLVGSVQSDQGDMRLPGAYPTDGLTAFYFDDQDIANMGPDAAPNSVGFGVVQALNPLRQAYATKVEQAIYYGASGSTVGGGWQPPTPDSDANFSARWCGAIFLDLDNVDYRFQMFGSSFRVWIGSTKFRDRLLEDWSSGGALGVPVVSAWLVGTAGTPGPLHGQHSGWYPIIVEWSEDGHPPQFTYQPGAFGGPTTYASGAWFIPGSVLYGPLQLTRNNIQAYWPLNSGLFAPAETDEVSAITLTPNGMGNTHFKWDRGPFPGSIAAHLNFDGGANSYFESSYANSGTVMNPINGKFSISAWIRLDTNSPSSAMVIIMSGTGSTGYQFRVNTTGTLTLNVNNGNLLTGTTILQANTWYHVAATHDGTQARLYINGALEAGPVNLTYTAASSGAMRIGAGGLFGTSPFTATNQFQGRIAHLAFYNTMISAANLLVDYNQQFIRDPVALSPLGVYLANIRFDSHYNQIATLLTSFGHQMTCVPRSLESGEFPGIMAPHVRIGRDTEFVLTDQEGQSQYSKTIDATDVADLMLADAQGLGTTDTTLTFETISEVDAQPKAHLFLNQDYEQQSQITDESVLRAYLESLLALRTSPWEALNAMGTGINEAVDTFPLTGALAAFRWQAGDGVRVLMPDIQAVDTLPRQITGVQWTLDPTLGATGPVVTFRDRPRDLYRTLRSLQQQIFNARRNYQTQVWVLHGSVAGYGNQQTAGSGGGLLAGVPTNVSRCGLPAALRDVIKAEVVIEQMVTPTKVSIFINSSKGGASDSGVRASKRGRYDVSGFIGRANGTDSFMSCFIRDNANPPVAIPTSAGYGGIFHLELTVKG